MTRRHLVTILSMAIAVGCGGAPFTSADAIGIHDAGVDGGDSGNGRGADAAGLPPATGDAAGTLDSAAVRETACGAMSCAQPLACCVSSGFTFACSQGPACPPSAGGGTSTRLECSGAASCGPRQECCIRLQNGQPVSACAASCAALGAAQMCDPNDPVSGCAPGVDCSSQKIADWSLPPSYATCGGIGN